MINPAWPNIILCVSRVFLYSPTYAGEDHFSQQVVASPGQHAPIVTAQGVLPHPSEGTLSFTI